MMRIAMLLSLLGIALGCAHKDPGKSNIKLSGRNATTAPEILNPEAVDASFDSTFYIGYVGYFPETKEFYTALFYKEGYENVDEEILEPKFDSVIISDVDWGRERLPMEEADKMLVLSGLDTIYIYNRRHQLISKAPLSRVEYLWNGLESYFIGVFKCGGTVTEQAEALYGISYNYPGFNASSFSAEEIEDDKLNKSLIGKLNIDPAMNWNMRHFRTKPHEATYSIISSYAMDSNEAQSYLTAIENSEVTILNQEFNNFHFLNILPLPMEVNDKPLLLISAGYPSSDVLWDYLAAFDGTTYEVVDYNRINPKAIHINQ
jgi:hypothetical protein